MANFVEQRAGFVSAFNEAFRAESIRDTAARLGPQVRGMDALEMSHRLGLLSWVPVDRFFRYRDRVGIPALHLQIVTAALQTALQSPDSRGVTLEIAEGPAEGVTVAETDGLITVTLIRTGYDPADATA